MKKKLFGFALIITIALPLQVFAGAPLDTVKGHVDKVLEVLRDPSLKGQAHKKVKEEKVRSISEKMFDFAELSRRALGHNWKRLNPDQQKEFISLFQRLLGDVYADKIMSYTDENIIFKKEVSLSEKTFEVQSIVVTKTAEIPINYRVIDKGGEWRVYDVVIEGVSLVNNYRSQFREILANKTPEALLETLRKKVGKA